jgi:hypothetical protein
MTTIRAILLRENLSYTLIDSAVPYLKEILGGYGINMLT